VIAEDFSIHEDCPEMNARTTNGGRRIITSFQKGWETLFYPGDRKSGAWFERSWLLGLFLIGLLTWCFFLNFGDLSFDLHDWTQEGPRYNFLRQSLLSLELPLHIGSELASTERFLAIPDTIISPQVLLLRFLPEGAFVLFNTLFLYSLGFLGLLLVRRKLDLSAITFTIVFLLFTFNGHIIAHLAVGHSMWVSYFLLPFFGYLILQILDGDTSWAWVTGMALLILGLFLNGGFHFVIYCGIFMILLGLSRREYLPALLKGLLFGGMLSLFRILPAAMEFGGRDKPFISGYFSATDLLSAFITLKPPWDAHAGLYASLGWWEVNVYLGLLGLSVLAAFGIYMTVMRFPEDRKNLRILLVPALIMSVLAMGKIYQPITLLPLPLLNAERVASRFIILPVFFVILLAGINIEQAIKNNRLTTRPRALILLFIILMGQDLFQHARLWRVEMMTTLFDITPVDIRADILYIPDPAYTTALVVGLLVGLGTLLYLFVRVRADHRSKETKRG
jgi:hypothetical protein